MSKKYAIGIETSSKAWSISLFEKGIVIETRVFSPEISLSGFLLEKIQELLRQNKVKLSNLEGLAVCLGPGSYTGLRVGIAVAKALAKSLGIFCIGVDLLELLRRSAGTKERIVSLIMTNDNKIVFRQFKESDNQTNQKPQKLLDFAKFVEILSEDYYYITTPDSLQRIEKLGSSHIKGEVNVATEALSAYLFLEETFSSERLLTEKYNPVFPLYK